MFLLAVANPREIAGQEWRTGMEEFFQVGIITSTHGVKGEVKVFPTTDDARRFKRLKAVIVRTNKEEVTLEVEGVKFFKQFVI